MGEGIGDMKRPVHWLARWLHVGPMTRPLWAAARTIRAAWRRRRVAARIFAELSKLSDDDLRRCGLERRDLYRRALDMAKRQPRDATCD
jgi:uncharacterized protein YjiS (DUF1127 family)